MRMFLPNLYTPPFIFRRRSPNKKARGCYILKEGHKETFNGSNTQGTTTTIYTLKQKSMGKDQNK